MRLSLWCCGLWLALCGAANASDVWASIAPVEVVTVRVHWVSVGELRAAARSVGKTPNGAPMAFSILRKNLETGGYSCDVYMPRKPRWLQDEATGSLGHEIAHCLGFSHE